MQKAVHSNIFIRATASHNQPPSVPKAAPLHLPPPQHTLVCFLIARTTKGHHLICLLPCSLSPQLEGKLGEGRDFPAVSQ